MPDESSIRLEIPVTVILERRMISRSFWTMPSWYLHTIAVGENVSVGDCSPKTSVALGASDNGDLYAWNGFQVTLYKDACERYWHALIGDHPLVYVVCRDSAEYSDDQQGPEVSPIIVTIDYDEATASAETDLLVLSSAIPPELYRYMESFVLQHYKPAPFKKRKRRNWSGAAATKPSGHV